MYNIRIVSHTEDDPASLLANPQNYRIHGQHQQGVLHGVLQKVGFVQSVIVNDVTGHIIDGHLRVHMALKNNVSHIPVTHVELSEEEERTILASFDPIGSLASIDKEKFKELMVDINQFDESIKNLINTDIPTWKDTTQQQTPSFDGQRRYMLLVELASLNEYTVLKDELLSRGYTIKGNKHER